MHEKAITFIEKLKQRDDVLAIILFGSWARNTNRPDSDTDLLVILEKGFERTVTYQDNHPIEITYTTIEAAVEYWNNNKDECADLWSVAEILYSKNRAAEQLKDSAEAILAPGKTAITVENLAHLQFDGQDQLHSIESLAQTDPATAHMLLSKKVYDLSGLFFDIRQMWTPAPKQRLAKIGEVDAVLHQKFIHFYSEVTNLSTKISIAQEIVEGIFRAPHQTVTPSNKNKIEL